jgi:Tfp pilus assembly protein PilF
VDRESLRVPIAWLAVVVFLAILRMVGSFSPPASLWGLDSLADMNPALSGLLLLFLFPLLKGPTLALGRLVYRIVSGRNATFLLFAATMGAVFVLFRSRNFLLGDSLLYVHAMDEGLTIESAGRREAGSIFVVSALHWSLRKTALGNSETAFVIASVAAGVVYILLAYAVARLMAESLHGRALIFASLVAMGAMQAFFGHAEYYSLVAASGTLHILLALYWLKGRCNLVFPAVSLALAVFVHIMNALLLPAFAWLFLSALRQRRYAQAVASSVLAPAVLIGVAAIIKYPKESFLKIFQKGLHMLPLQESRHYAYSVFEPTHLSEVANELLLTAPCLPLLFAAILWAGRRRGRDASASEHAGDTKEGAAAAGQDRNGSCATGLQSVVGAKAPGPHAMKGYLLFLALGAGFFCLTANPALGMARDWDIFVFPFIVLTLVASIVAAGRVVDERRLLWLCGAVTVIGGLHLGLFVANNRTPEAYVPRFRRIAMEGDFFTESPRGELWRYLGWEAIKAGDNRQAKEDLLRSIRDWPEQLKSYKMLATLEIGRQHDWLASDQARARRTALRLDTEEKIMGEAARLGLNSYYNNVVAVAPMKARALLGGGLAALKVLAPDSIVVDAFRRAVEADPSDTEARAFWGDMHRLHGQLDEAERDYAMVLAVDKWHIRSFLGRACILGARGEPELAFILAKELREHYPWSIEAQVFMKAWEAGELSEPEDFRNFMVTQ